MSWKFDPFIPPHPPTSSEVGFFVFRKEDASRHPLFSACQKSLAEFAARRRQRNKIIFSRDMCVRENTSQAASVEFVRLRRTNYARSRPQAFCRKNPEGFSTVSKKRTPLGILFFTQLNRWRITSARPWRRLPPAPSSCSLHRPWTGLPSEWWESPQQPSWPQPGPDR